MAICISQRKTVRDQLFEDELFVVETSIVFQFISKDGGFIVCIILAQILLSLYSFPQVFCGFHGKLRHLGRASWAWPIVAAHEPLGNGLFLCSLSEGWKREGICTISKKKLSHFISPKMSWINQKETKIKTTPSLCPSSQKYVQMQQGARELL